MLTTQGELAMMDVVPGSPGITLQPGEVLVVARSPHKVGRFVPGVPDTRVKYWPGQQYACQRSDAEHAQARGLVHIVGDKVHDWWGSKGRVLSPFAEDQERPYATAPSAGALKIAQGTGYDPGSAAYRFHSAINATTKHSSCFIRWGDTNPHCSLRQLDGEGDAAVVRDAVVSADVLHNHIGYFLLNNTQVQSHPGQLVVIHYHGSRPDGQALCGERFPGTRMSLLEWDAIRFAKVVGARISLVEEIRTVAKEKSVDITPEWLPIPMDVARYRALVPKTRRPGPFRIAHSPTNRRFKGSDFYDAAIATLQAKGLQVEAVSIMGRSLGDALRLKADCDAVFDSFWLGMQGSGLEGAAMGLPVIAGDPTVRALHVEQFGLCPYTYANDERELTEVIERLVTDPSWRSEEASRVSTFVEAYHDYAAVGRRYEKLLAKWTGRTDLDTPLHVKFTHDETVHRSSRRRR